MIQLDSTTTYFWMFLISFLLGVLGGLGAELLLVRGDRTGLFELPHGSGSNRIQLGFLASALVGGLAAVAIYYFFPPDVVTFLPDGTESRHYEVVKLVSLAILAGIAGNAVLTTAKSTIEAQVHAKAAETTKKLAKAKIRDMKKQAGKEAAKAAESAVRASAPELHRQVNEAARETPLVLHESLTKANLRQIAPDARDIIEARTPARSDTDRERDLEATVEAVAKAAGQRARERVEDAMGSDEEVIDAFPE